MKRMWGGAANWGATTCFVCRAPMRFRGLPKCVEVHAGAKCFGRLTQRVGNEDIPFPRAAQRLGQPFRLVSETKQCRRTGVLPGARVSRETCTRPTHDQALEAWRAWQRKTGNTNPPIRPLPGRVPPNFFGWKPVNAPSTTLVPPGPGGTVLADGQNVVITGSGFANITQAYSV